MKYRVIENGDDYVTRSFPSPSAALEFAEMNIGDYDTSTTVWVDVKVEIDLAEVAVADALDIDPDDVLSTPSSVTINYGDLLDAYRILAAGWPEAEFSVDAEGWLDADFDHLRREATVTVDPPEPDCVDGHAHVWEAPYSALGGLKENPGVWGRGGGVSATAICRHCGTYREVDTWAQRPDTGEQGLVSTEYRDADDVSLAYVLRVALRRQYDAAADKDAHDAAVQSVTGVDVRHDYSGVNNSTVTLHDLDDVTAILEAVKEASAA